MQESIRKQVKDLLEIKMLIPLFEGGSRFNFLQEEEVEIPLTDARAVEMAIQNVEWQVDNEYFDATIEIWVHGELFYENSTTDAYGTWCGLMYAIEKRGKHTVCFLDSMFDLTIIHEKQYIFQCMHTDYVWGDDNVLISRSKKLETSEPLPKDVVETAITQGFKQYAAFIVENDIPISTAYKENLRERLAEV